MSDVKFSVANTSNLAQRLQSTEKSLEFIQREHASTLSNLHDELAKWQQKYSDLTFQVAVGGTVINSEDDSKLRAKVEKFQSELNQCKDKIKDLNKILEEKEKMIKDYENRLIVNDRNHALELHTQYHKQRELNIELEKRSTLVAQLTNQLHTERQQQQNVRNRIHLGKLILPDKPSKLKHNDLQQQQQQRQSLPSGRHLANRSSSISYQHSPDQELTKVLFIGRRPLTPPQRLQPIMSKSIESRDDPLNTKRQRQLLNNDTDQAELNKLTSSRPAIKFSTALPPIVNRKMPLKAFTTATLQPEGQA